MDKVELRTERPQVKHTLRSLEVKTMFRITPFYFTLWVGETEGLPPHALFFQNYSVI
jgi:hypothetical protein